MGSLLLESRYYAKSCSARLENILSDRLIVEPHAQHHNQGSVQVTRPVVEEKCGGYAQTLKSNYSSQRRTLS